MLSLLSQEIFKNKTKDKISLIYHTTPWRGLEILLRVFKDLELENVKLNVCSSTIIYGKKFDEILGKKYEKIFDECKSMKNVNYLGFIKNLASFYIIFLYQNTKVLCMSN